MMLLHKPESSSFVPPVELDGRFVAFSNGQWAQLLEAAKPPARNGTCAHRRSAEEEEAQRQNIAIATVRM